MLEHLSGRWKSRYFEYICEIKNTISLPFVFSRSDIKESLQCHFMKVLNDEISRSNLPAYKPVSSIARGFFVSEVETSALTVGMKVNNCRENPTQGKDRSKTCPFCPGIMASEYHVAWVCPRLSSIRRDLGIISFKNALSLESFTGDKESYYAYINGLNKHGVCIDYPQFETRISNLTAVRSTWFSLM
jgi:hypothetical protein